MTVLRALIAAALMAAVATTTFAQADSAKKATPAASAPGQHKGEHHGKKHGHAKSAEDCQAMDKHHGQGADSQKMASNAGQHGCGPMMGASAPKK